MYEDYNMDMYTCKGHTHIVRVNNTVHSSVVIRYWLIWYTPSVCTCSLYYKSSVYKLTPTALPKLQLGWCCCPACLHASKNNCA